MQLSVRMNWITFPGTGSEQAGDDLHERWRKSRRRVQKDAPAVAPPASIEEGRIQQYPRVGHVPPRTLLSARS